MNVAIIGVGQLGSRYLQGIVKSDLKFSIYLVDLNLESIEKAKLGIKDVLHDHSLFSYQSIEDLPKSLDLVIISTNADIRAKIVKVLLNTLEIKYLILEKVLFQKESDLIEIGDLLKEKNVDCWVNHPKRIFKSYNDLKSILPDRQKPLGLMATGVDWGLACNGLHVIDTWSFLFDDYLENCNLISVHSKWVESKRKGFLDINGSMLGYFEKGTPFTLVSEQGPRASLTISMDFPDCRVTIEEVNHESAIRYYKKGKPDPIHTMPFQMEYQSSISGTLLEDILLNGNCGLPTYSIAAKNHAPFLKGLSDDFFKREISKEFNCLPIT
jgi:hypothetical protein